MNPISRFQASKQLVILVHEECLRLASYQWSAQLQSIDIGGKDVPILSLAADYGAEDIVNSLITSFEGYLDSLVVCDDAVCSFVGQHIAEVRTFVLFDESVKNADSIAVERILLGWQPLFALTGKTKYVELVARWIEVAYREMEAAVLQNQRVNRFVRITVGKGCIGMDDFCEMVNLWVKTVGGSNDIDALIIKTQYLSLMRRCAKTVDALHGPGHAAVKSTTAPKDAAERKIIYRLLELSGALENKGRPSLDDVFWKHVAAVTQQAH